MDVMKITTGLVDAPGSQSARAGVPRDVADCTHSLLSHAMTIHSRQLRRSVLYVPAANARAVAKARELPCDVIVFDLEDAVAPAMKEAARMGSGQDTALCSAAHKPF